MQPMDQNRLTALQNLYEMMKTQNDLGVVLRQSYKLKLLLTVPKCERNDEQLKQIGFLVQRMKFLSHYREKPYFKELCRNLYVKIFNPKQVICKQGDEGASFCVILRGLVKVYADEPTQLEGFWKKREVAVLSKGDCFGEISLFFGSLRTATVVAESECDLLMLDREVFSKFVQDDPDALDLQTSNLNDIRKFLQKVKQFSHFTYEEMTRISTKCSKHVFAEQTIICKQGSVPKHIYIIRNGEIKVLLRMGNQITEIDDLQKGNIFGDDSFFKNESSKYTYMTSIKSELILLTGFDLKQYVEKERFNQYLTSIPQYPEFQTLQEMKEEQSQWLMYKKQLMKNVLNDKRNSRGFDRRMRLPELRYKLVDPPDLKVFQKTFILQSSSPSVNKKLFKREIESMRNQISPKRMRLFEQNYM